MISITFGLGFSGSGGGVEFYPESEFSVVLEDDIVITFNQEETILAEVVEDTLLIRIEPC